MESYERSHERYRDTEKHRYGYIFLYRNTDLPDIGEYDRRSIGSEFDDEDGEGEIGMDEVIEFPYKWLVFRCSYSGLLREDTESITSYTIEEKITEDISYPPQEKDDVNIEHSKWREKCSCEGHNRSLDDHETEHENISSRLKWWYDSRIEVGI